MESKISKAIPRTKLNPWTEVRGTVAHVCDDSLTISTTQRHTLLIGREELARWSPVLRKGSHVGVLLLDDGSIRVRLIDAIEGV